MNKINQKIITIGGGTGSFTLLSGLKSYPIELSAIVSMADDGGSTGVLCDELGVLPPGDVRQCLVALSESSQMLRELFNYRYYNGSLAGHNFGNIFLSTLEKTSGSFDKAIKEASKVLRIRGRVVPVTLMNIKLVAVLNSGKKIIGQHNIDEADLTNLKRLKLKPKAIVNPEAVAAIKKADKIIINPGNLFCSIIPNLLADGFSQAIKQTKGKVIYICNLMTKLGQTTNFSVIDYIKTIENYLGKDIIKIVIYNKEHPDEKLIKRYNRKGEHFVKSGDLSRRPKIKFIAKNILSHKIYQQTKGDRIERTLIRHDSDKIAKIIYNLS